MRRRKLTSSSIAYAAAEQEFNEAIRNIRYDGVHISEMTHEALNICGRISERELEILLSAYKKWKEATIYKPEE